MFMTRVQLWVAIILAVILAVPMVTFVSALVVFPLIVFAALAVAANVGAALLVLEGSLRASGRRFIPDASAAKWELSIVVWLGCAYGLSHWGDVARAMGATNLPYLKVLFAPLLFLFGMKVF